MSVMDFDLSKENIQPLRGGRNISQLEVALQAQINEDIQRELIQQKEAFESAIRNYEGDDPLENWYHYISWVEQSFPKHGHEGNLVALLEDCLAKFEHDKRYIHDRRFCKLWIKYIDMQPNPLELFQMMHAQGLCRSCADLYRAWAYYHEAIGDFKSADMVFQLGQQEFAQPYEELITAHRNLVYAAGQQMIRGTEADAHRLEEQRKALTTLSTYSHGKMVPSIRIPVSSGAGILPSNSKSASSKQNIMVSVYQDKDNSRLQGAEAIPPVSILTVAKRQQAPKENTLKPGVWTTALPMKKGLTAHRTPAFTVHEDVVDLHAIGIKLPAEFYPVCHEDFTNWRPPLAYHEPDDPCRVPMYPKSKVYANPQEEISIEEIKARKYKSKSINSRLNVSLSETHQAIQSILGEGNSQTTSTGSQVIIKAEQYSKNHMQENLQQSGMIQFQQAQQYMPHPEQYQYQHQHPQSDNTFQSNLNLRQQGAIKKSQHFVSPQQNDQQISNSFGQSQHQIQPQNSLFGHSVQHQQINSIFGQVQQQNQSFNQQQSQTSFNQQQQQVNSFTQPQQHNHFLSQQMVSPVNRQQQVSPYNQFQNAGQQFHQQQNFQIHQLQIPQQQQARQQNHFQFLPQNERSMHSQMLNQSLINKSKSKVLLVSTPSSQRQQAQFSTVISSGFANSSQHVKGSENKESNSTSEFGKDMIDLWRSTTEDDSMSLPPTKGNAPNFIIYEESAQEEIQPKGTAMKSPPFKIMNDEELAETGSRGGLDVAAAAQPGDGAKRIPIFEDDSSSSLGEVAGPLSTTYQDLNTSCNTQIFNFNLNAMQVSTPQSKQRAEPSKEILPEDTLKQSKKMLFGNEPEKKRMSTIFEETKDYRSSSSGSSTTLKLVTSNHSKRENLAIISEEQSNYTFNLAQNLKANAALRSSLLGELMECESGQSSPVTEIPPALQAPVAIQPLSQAPSDPFKSSVIDSLLKHIGFPGRHTAGYIEFDGTPRFTIKKEPCRIGDDRYMIEKILGKGTYGQVYKATNLRTKEAVALKIQKPPNKWEFYICREIQSRLAKHPLKDRFMQVHIGYFHNQMSILVSEFSRCGSLLDVANAVKQKTGKTLKEPICIFFSMEMLSIVQTLHKAKIIHADIKPDNFLVQLAPDQTIMLQLIDFGCSIDMSLFPNDTTFTRCVTTEDFICCEMRDGRPWSYHTDLFCVAASAHVLLFDKYIQLQKKDGHWSITQRFTRYMSLELWNTFFGSLLNQQSGPADAEPLLNLLREAFYQTDRSADMRYLVNILKDR